MTFTINIFELTFLIILSIPGCIILWLWLEVFLKKLFLLN